MDPTLNNSQPTQGKKRQILHAIVEANLDSGEAVTSYTNAQRRFTCSSPSSATVRNAMAELTELGFLTQPHTSAGRIPTPLAIQSYVSSLGQVKANPAEVSKLQQRLKAMHSLAERVEEGSHVLTGLTRNVGITASVPPASQLLHQVELLPLAARQYLMVVITSDRAVRNQVVSVYQDLRPEELQEMRNYINQEFAGWTLADARRALTERLQDERNQYHSLLKRIEIFYAQGLFEGSEGPRVFLDGAAYLVGLDLHLTREKMRELFQALEQKQQVLQMLDQFLQGSDQTPAIQIGLGEAHPALSEFSLVGVHVPLGSGMTARVAVLGPLRLNYPRTIAAVMEVGQALAESAL
ncbi:MAG: heat-inducible transcriptional repressor HrcA [Acidobacteria bacterium]|nr:heat-inducible transcriptional repressor HrcA [Acidobacteriota bacterium]